ncbi:MAG: DUF2225 domain-containing protein [Clostridia bacterium]|jgi:uncharacterized protein (DUF2225 family)|nr:DUF2225 domain-containing protein [Clostridia bacterium]
MENHQEISLLYDRKYECLYCGEKFTGKKIRQSKLMLDRRDPDYCCHYKQESPYFYEVNVCPHCGFAYTDSFVPPNPAQRGILKRTYLDKAGSLDLCGERSLVDAEKSYKLALLCATLSDQNGAIIAGLLMRLAWINRFAGKKEEEEKHLAKALSAYEFIYMNGDGTAQKMGKHQLLYLLGEISGRIGKMAEAKRWFSQLFLEKNIEPSLDKLARDRWQDFKGVS